MNSKADKLVRRTTMVATIKNAILSAEDSVKGFILGTKKERQESETKKLAPSVADKHP